MTPRRVRRATISVVGDFFVDEKALSFGLGYAPDDWEALALHLSRDGADLGAARATGLIGEAQPRQRPLRPVPRPADVHDPRRGREHRSASAHERSVRWRVPKYINSSDFDIFHKGAGVYGLSWALRSIREQGRAVVVEGYFDVLSRISRESPPPLPPWVRRSLRITRTS